MKVFISWSGERSKALAQALHEWLPLVLQYVKPFVSEKDISAGDRWAQAIAGELESSNFGIICVTPENLQSEWVLFEAGALSKSMQDGKVIPLLFGLELSDISGPLAQFQAKKVDQHGLGEVIKAINNISDTKTADEIVNQLVPALWSKLEELLDKIPDVDPSDDPKRPQTEILEELVTGVRGLEGRMRNFDLDASERWMSGSRHKLNHFNPIIFDQLRHMSLEFENDPVTLLILAGFVRNEIPWFSEVLVESYREIQVGGRKEVEKHTRRLLRLTKMLRHGPLMEVFENSKEMHFLMMELPHLIENILHEIRHDKLLDSDD